MYALNAVFTERLLVGYWGCGDGEELTDVGRTGDSKCITKEVCQFFFSSHAHGRVRLRGGDVGEEETWEKKRRGGGEDVADVLEGGWSVLDGYIEPDLGCRAAKNINVRLSTLTPCLPPCCPPARPGSPPTYAGCPLTHSGCHPSNCDCLCFFPFVSLWFQWGAQPGVLTNKLHSSRAL